MQVAVHFQNDVIAQRVLWMLEHFKSDGVEVIYLDDDDKQIVDRFREGVEEIKEIEKGRLKARPIEELLSEL